MNEQGGFNLSRSPPYPHPQLLIQQKLLHPIYHLSNIHHLSSFKEQTPVCSDFVSLSTNILCHFQDPIQDIMLHLTSDLIFASD